MVKMTLAEALEKIRQGCTELDLYGACSGAPSHPAAPPLAHVCGGRVQRAAPSVLPHALAAPTARAPRRAAGCGIGDEGAKELAAALETNTTLTTLDLNSACSGATPTPAAPLRARTSGGRAARRPERSPHALAAPTARAPP
eukprot:scaffold18933_cov63-Phaeocystis_antarctica.AAC.2